MAGARHNRHMNSLKSVVLVILTSVMFVEIGHTDEINGCFIEAGKYYAISPLLLRVIAEQESGLNELALNENVNGSLDVGLMQINSQWFDEIESQGVRKEELWDPCINIFVGAWVLARNIARYGYTWSAVGAYNAGTAETQQAESRRSKYAWQIAKKLNSYSSDWMQQ